MYPRYGMVECPVPSSSNNLPKGWAFRVIHLHGTQGWHWKPEPLSWFMHGLFFPSFNYRGLIGLSNQVRQWGLDSKNGLTRAASHGPVHQAAFLLAGLCLGVGVGMWETYCWLGCSYWPAGGWAPFPKFPPDWFKAMSLGFGHSLAMWLHPHHLKYWREFGSCLLAVPSLLVLGPLVTLFITSISNTPCHSMPSAGKLQAGMVCPGPLLSLWEF